MSTSSGSWRVRIFISFCALVTTVKSGASSEGLLIPSLPLPGTIRGAREGTAADDRMWVLSANGRRIFEVTESGARRLPERFPEAKGLAFDGSLLWLANEKVRLIVGVRPENGEAVREIWLRAPMGRGFRSVEGLTWDGEFFWTAIEAGYSSTLNQVRRADGAIVRSIYSDCHPRGIAVRGERLFCLCYNGERNPLTVEERTLGGSDLEIQSSRRIIGRIYDGRASGLVFKEDRLFYVDEDGAAAGAVQPLGSGPTGGGPESPCVERNAEESKDASDKKYAILIGAQEADFDDAGGAEFWYDLISEYRMLREAGFAHSRIHVLYGSGSDFPTGHCEFNGKAQFGTDITDWPATKANVEAVFESVGQVVGSESFVYVWWMGHGVSSGTDQCDLKMSMRTGEFVSDKEFAEFVEMLGSAQVVIALMTCHSGGILDDLARLGNMRVIALASSECRQPSFSASATCNGHEHSEFDYSETAAVRERDVCGGLVSSDNDRNGEISVGEILDFLKHGMHSSSPLLGGASVAFAFPRLPE
jgi:hypothetical protein